MISVAIEASRKAGELLRERIGRAGRIDRKGGEATNLVTDADRNAEKIIVETLRSHFPDHGFLAEESGATRRDSEYCWIIDPLDGTTNFAHGLPIFCTSIALEVRGDIVLGVVYDPMRNELFRAEKGNGAYLNDSRIEVSRTSRLAESLLVTGFPYNVRSNPRNAIQHFSQFLIRTRAVRRLGSAALDLCYVAAGRFDGFWEVFLNPWDMAAGVLLVQEAGGVFTDLEGHPSTVHESTLLVSNGHIHDAMVQVLKENISG